MCQAPGKIDQSWFVSSGFFFSLFVFFSKVFARQRFFHTSRGNEIVASDQKGLTSSELMTVYIQDHSSFLINLRIVD